jgi:SHS2 domain-containing protein
MPTRSESQGSKSIHKADFEEVEHTADWALRVRGRDLQELLINAARGIASLIVADPANLPHDEEKELELESIDAESLLVDWLSELAYWAEAEMLVFHQFELQEVTPTSLRATVRGGHAPELTKHIKAVTYHNLEIVETPEGMEATVVFDV